MGMRAHLRVETGERVVADLDVNDFEISATRIVYRTWQQGAKSEAEEHEIAFTSDIVRLELTPPSDRLKRED